MRIGILGGTFDPVHNGHLTLAQKAREVVKVDMVLFVPSFIPPHKQGRHIASVEDRLAMLKKVLDPFSFCAISSYELEQQNVCYTVDTLRALRAQYPEGTEFYFFVGSDFVHEYTTWKEYTALPELATFVVAPRPGFTCGELPAWMTLLKEVFPAVSSTNIRDAVRCGKSIASFVPPVVEEYVRKHGLYVEG